MQSLRQTNSATGRGTELPACTPSTHAREEKCRQGRHKKDVICNELFPRCKDVSYGVCVWSTHREQNVMEYNDRKQRNSIPFIGSLSTLLFWTKLHASSHLTFIFLENTNQACIRPGLLAAGKENRFSFGTGSPFARTAAVQHTVVMRCCLCAEEQEKGQSASRPPHPVITRSCFCFPLRAQCGLTFRPGFRAAVVSAHPPQAHRTECEWLEFYYCLNQCNTDSKVHWRHPHTCIGVELRMSHVNFAAKRKERRPLVLVTNCWLFTKKRLSCAHREATASFAALLAPNYCKLM